MSVGCHAHPPAAVYEESDPRAELAARAVPKGARFRRVGGCVLGYDHDPHAFRRGWSPDKQRVAEIEHLIRARHGGAVDTDDGTIYLEIVFPHLPAGSARAWAAAMTPLLTDEEFLSVAATEPKRLTATEAGRRLALTHEERDELKIRTMRAVGQTEESMKEERRKRDVAAARAKRAAQPKKIKLKDSRPWEAEGVSYRTWRRRRAAERGQKSVGSNSLSTIADEKLAKPKSRARPEGRAARQITVPAETIAKLREISRIAANVNHRVGLIARDMHQKIAGMNSSRFTATLRPVASSVGSIAKQIEQSQPSTIPVKTKTNNRRAVA